MKIRKLFKIELRDYIRDDFPGLKTSANRKFQLSDLSFLLLSFLLEKSHFGWMKFNGTIFPSFLNLILNPSKVLKLEFVGSTGNCSVSGVRATKAKSFLFDIKNLFNSWTPASK